MKKEITPPVPADKTIKIVPKPAPKITPAATHVAEAAPGMTANEVTTALKMKKFTGLLIFGITSSFNDRFLDPCMTNKTATKRTPSNAMPLTHNSIGIFDFLLSERDPSSKTLFVIA
jgi:hypothetical protein